ncbi:glycosyl transferase family 25 [Acetobacter aceti NBRC 14818]|nr:glycosyl transferase family 25 [Acetobacter aceti NBRC 14818]
MEPALGVMMSYLRLWKHAVASNHTVTVLENDAVLHKRCDSLTRQLMEHQDPFDCIALGVNTDWPITFPIMC